MAIPCCDPHEDPLNGAPAPSSKGLKFEEALIFEQGQNGRIGVDIADVPDHESHLGGLVRDDIDLPDLSEPQVVRHYTRLSQQNYSIDSGFYPLGSCTMKHNPRLNEQVARLPGLARIHPLQQLETVPGAVTVMADLFKWLTTLTGLPYAALSPAAGAHGELCGIMTIKAALKAKGQAHRNVILVPESAHGTNPATAAGCGFKVKPIPANDKGLIDLEALKAAIDDTTAAIMVTNPNTCGLFEEDIIEAADAIHAVGGYFYCDGANFNAIAGRVRLKELGVDAMHINLHKTFSTPHGGGGPGSGPVVLSDALAPYAPLPVMLFDENGNASFKQRDANYDGVGRMKAFYGQFGTFVRALAFMQAMGCDGLRQMATDAVLNANYIRVQLKDHFNAAYDGICMHEVVFDDSTLKAAGIGTLDFAKALIDEGYHPMTMYFPLVVQGAMLIEPTESETKRTLDNFIKAMKRLVDKARSGDKDTFLNAPIHAPRQRLDETGAARKPVLVYGS